MADAAAAREREHWAHHATLLENHAWLQRQAARGLPGMMAHLVPDLGASDTSPYLVPALHEATGLASASDSNKRRANSPAESHVVKRPAHAVAPGGSSSPSPPPVGGHSPAAGHSPALHSAAYFKTALNEPHAHHVAIPGIWDATSPRPEEPAVETTHNEVAWGNGMHKLVWSESKAIASGHFGSVFLAQELDADGRRVAAHCVKIVRFADYVNIDPMPVGNDLDALKLELYHDAAKE